MEKHDSIFAELGCVIASVPGGIDTRTAQHYIAGMCTGHLLDECGGHREQYHYHESASCLYNLSSPGHSALIGYAEDGKGIYGMYE